MAEPEFLSWDELRNLARAHLESLRAAGVEWLPAAPPVSHSPTRARSPVEATPRPGIVANTMAQKPTPAADNLFVKEDPVSPRLELPVEERRQKLTVLATEVKSCMRCPELASTRTQTVFGVGAIKPDLCLIGEAPGADEDREGEPFVGAAGKLLNKILIACGLERSDVFICNILKCRPPGNRAPLPHESANCRGYLDAQLELVQPRFICALGATAAQNLLGTTESIGRMRGKFYDYKGIRVFATYHPSYLLRSPDKKRDVWADMQVLMREMGRTIPPQKSI
jgi:uracil-DNA glycosylase